MSEQSQGPGWWLASDGKWYSPEAHPGYRPPPPPATSPPPQRTTLTIPTRESLEWAALVGAAVLVLGSFMKWATAGPFSVNGTDGDGWITIIAGVAAGWRCWKQSYLWASVIAGVGLVVVIWKFADLGSIAEDSIITVSPGAGLYVCGLGAGMCVVTSLQRWWQVRGE